MTHTHLPRDICPICSSESIVPIDAVDEDAEADELTADVGPLRAEPPNTRCESCGHTWWLAPRAPKIDPDQEGVPE
jgi:hypothetical protein